MNIPDYITSGILESYVLGTVSDQERREVECLSGIYPDLRQELDRLTLTLENYALLHSVEPPADLQERIRSRLTLTPTPEAPQEPEEEGRVVPLHRERPVFQGAWVAAAAVGLVLIAFSYYLVSQLRSTQQRGNQLAGVNLKLQQEVDQLRQQQQRDTQLLALLRQPGLETVRLAAAKPGNRADVLVYWNRSNQQVTLEVESLPELASDQQYQLWALVDGKPVDAGVFASRVRSFTLQKQAKVIPRADQFAITIEKLGGSPTPTLSALVAVGKVV